MLGNEAGQPAADGKTGRWPRWFFPGGVRLWHFLAVPTMAMPAVILVFEFIEHRTGVPTDSGYYSFFRSVVISAVMASLIGVLAYTYRRRFVRQLQARNDDLVATRDFLTGIIQGSGEGIFTCDDQDRVTSWNRAAEAIYGFTSAEMKGRPVTDLFAEDSPAIDEWRDVTRRLRGGETAHHFQAEQRRKDGHCITVKITRSPLVDRNDKHSGSMGLVDDISEIKEMESLLREKERLAGVGQLAASVAHEIKNPLAGIRGACEIIDRRFGPGDSEKELTEEVLREVDRLNRTVTDLLDFARPRTVVPVASDIHEILDSVVALTAEDPRSRSVTVECRYDDALPVVHVDPHRMEQVFLNLVLNSFEAMDYDGHLTLSTRVNSRFAIVRVEDNGRGIDPADAKKIFEPFFTTRVRGWGLGLAVVRSILQDHGGRIELDTPSGGGAAFDVYLPMEG